MKSSILFGLSALFGASLCTVAAPKDDVIAAAKKLGDQPNYSWKTTVSVPEGSRFRPGPTEGKTEKDGFTHVTWSFGDNTTEVVLKGEKGAVTNQDGAWESLSEADQAEGFGRMRAVMARNLKAPAVQAAELAAGVKDLQKDGDACSGELTEATAKTLLAFGRRPGGDAPEATGVKGSAKFWLKDGALTKYEYKVKGKMSFNGQERDVDRTTTVEIKDVGATKVSVPEAAKKKLS
jgi:hypothetical protein